MNLLRYLTLAVAMLVPSLALATSGSADSVITDEVCEAPINDVIGAAVEAGWIAEYDLTGEDLETFLRLFNAEPPQTNFTATRLVMFLSPDGSFYRMIFATDGCADGYVDSGNLFIDSLMYQVWPAS